MRFTITFDYLCPFARNANEHVLTALEAGADFDVTFTPYSLAQGHVADGDPDVWDVEDPDEVSGLLALQVGVAVRDRFPEHFLAVHRELFAARHDRDGDLRDREVLVKALDAAGADPDAVMAVVDSGAFLPVVRDEHRHNAEELQVWGVPTFIAGDRAVFVRVLDRPDGDTARAIDRIERIVTLVEDFPELHEFKQVDLPF